MRDFDVFKLHVFILRLVTLHVLRQIGGCVFVCLPRDEHTNDWGIRTVEIGPAWVKDYVCLKLSGSLRISDPPGWLFYRKPKPLSVNDQIVEFLSINGCTNRSY